MSPSNLGSLTGFPDGTMPAAKTMFGSLVDCIIPNNLLIINRRDFSQE